MSADVHQGYTVMFFILGTYNSILSKENNVLKKICEIINRSKDLVQETSCSPLC